MEEPLEDIDLECPVCGWISCDHLSTDIVICPDDRVQLVPVKE